MKKLTLYTLLSFIFFLNSMAQNKMDEDGVRACLQQYMSGQGDSVEKAFHPSATMKYIDPKTGEFKDVPIAEYIARVKSNAGGGNSDRKIEIVSMNVEGNAAHAKIKILTGSCNHE